VKFKTCEDIETITTTFIGIKQQAAQVATPKRNPLSLGGNLPSDIKCLVAIKRRAKSKGKKPTLQITNVYLIMQATN